MAIYELGGGSSGAALPINISDVTNLQTNLDSKAPTVHNHPIAEINGLQLELDKPYKRIGQFTVGVGGTYPTIAECIDNSIDYLTVEIELLSNITEVKKTNINLGGRSLVINGNGHTVETDYQFIVDTGTDIRISNITLNNHTARILDAVHDFINIRIIKFCAFTNVTVNTDNLTAIAVDASRLELSGYLNINAGSLIASYGIYAARGTALVLNAPVNIIATEVGIGVDYGSTLIKHSANDNPLDIYINRLPSSSYATGIAVSNSSSFISVSSKIHIHGNVSRGILVSNSSTCQLNFDSNNPGLIETSDTSLETFGFHIADTSNLRLTNTNLNNWWYPYFCSSVCEMYVVDNLTDTNTRSAYSVYVTGNGGNAQNNCFVSHGQPVAKAIL